MKVSWYKRLSRRIRGRLRSRVLGQHGVAVLAQAHTGLFAVDPADFNVSRALLRDGQYGRQEIAVLTTLLQGRADPHLIFVGSHIGALLVPIARATGPRRILAYEPSPDNRRLLELNLRLNGVEGVQLRPAAVGDEAGVIGFTQNRINTGNSRIARARGDLQVPIVTLDETVPPEWQRIDLMVMDVEGFEVHAMRGGAHTLARTDHLLIEYAPEQLLEQGSSPAQFLRLVTAHFPSLYLLGPPPRFLGRAEYSSYLQALPSRRGLLLNLLFSQDEQPDARVLAAAEAS